MENITESIDTTIDRACSATEKFIREYSNKMRHPVAQLVSIVHSPRADALISETDLASLHRLIREIDQILNGLLSDLQRDDSPNQIH